MISVLIAGDIYPGAISAPFLSRAEVDPVLNDLKDLFAAADLRLGNLEGPLIEPISPIQKIGPVHAIPESCINGLKAAGFDILNLGNNHTMDQGVRGLHNTRSRCEETGIGHVGAGENLSEAARPLIRVIKGIRVAFLSCTEHEFGVATPHEAGTNPIDVIQFCRTVAARRHEWDHLIVLLHGGNEYYPYPRPDLRDLCHFFIEQGAGAVICQHSHCAGCYENYRGGYIVYGQGNFIFDERSSRSCEQEGFLVRLEIDGANIRMVPLPFFQSSGSPGPSSSAHRAKQFLIELNSRSENLLKPGFVEQEWQRFCQANQDRYLSLLQGYGRRIRQLDLKFKFLRFFRSEKRMRMMLHLLRCESHRELLITTLNQAIANSKKQTV